jgi:hypothetical protein
VLAAFALTTAASYFTPAFGSFVGRAMGIVFLGHAGTKPLGLVAIAPLYAVVEPEVVFALGGVTLFGLALASAAAVYLSAARATAARAVG